MMKIRFVFSLLVVFANDAVAEWNQFQGDSAHTGYVAWNYNTGRLAPAWTHPLERIADNVVIVGSSLFVTQREFGVEGTGTISRIDTVSGHAVWSTDLRYRSPDRISAPAVQGDTVYVHRFGHSSSPASSPPEEKPALVGLDVADGSVRFVTPHSGQWSSGSRPTVDGGAVFTAGGYFGGLDAYGLNGVSLWAAKVNQQYGWIPAADDQHVYTYMGSAGFSPGPSVGQLYIADRRTGSLTSIAHPRSTSTRSGGSDDGSVMLDGLGNAYALSGVRGGSTLVSFDIGSSSINWEADGAWLDNPSIANGLIALPERRSVVFLDAVTGSRLWAWDHTSNIVGSVLLTDGAAFVNSSSGVFGIDLYSQEVFWHTPVSGRLAASNGSLFITNGTGIYAYSVVPEPASGALFLSVVLSAWLMSKGTFRHSIRRSKAG
jgi:hypothetical protein